MATSMPWSVKGVDPRTRDAAKTAARRAGMTLGEWLDHKIREESEADAARAETVRPVEAAPKSSSSRRKAPEQLDIAALSERLADTRAGLSRVLAEGRDETVRALAAREHATAHVHQVHAGA